MLAVLPQAPSRLRPDRWPERAEAARNKVLERMAVQGVWSREQVKESRGRTHLAGTPTNAATGTAVFAHDAR